MTLPCDQLGILGVPAPALPSRPLTPGDYLTDESFLFRVVGRVPGDGDGVVALEDCYRLDVVRVRIDDLAKRRLRAVTPAATACPVTRRAASDAKTSRR
jgi:hypothetical protein